MNLLLDNTAMAAKFGSRASELAAEKFSVEKMVKTTENFYERILAEP
jgi:glycosyltransferase involved in cell wall biosynthesis